MIRRRAIQVYDWLFKTGDGSHVFGQRPNWPLYGIVVLSLAARLIQNDSVLTSVLSSASSLLAVYWAYLEIRSGVNRFRKILGVVVMLIALVGLVNQISGS